MAKEKTRVRRSSKRLEQRAKYKMIPVDEQTYERLISVCQIYGRKQGAQVKLLVDSEYEKLPKAEDESAETITTGE
jgi:hypothetical protein